MTDWKGSRNPIAHVFGYGSLVAPQSVSRTLGRSLDPTMMPVAVLRDYQRDWEIKIPVTFEDGYACDAMFLDVTVLPGFKVNGVLVPVTEEELAAITRREAQYDPVDVTSLIDTAVPVTGTVLVFRGRDEHRRQHSSIPAVVPRRYRELVENAMSTRGTAFAAMFHDSTVPPTGSERSGAYQFTDPRQELATRPGNPTKKNPNTP